MDVQIKLEVENLDSVLLRERGKVKVSSDDRSDTEQRFITKTFEDVHACTT